MKSLKNFEKYMAAIMVSSAAMLCPMLASANETVSETPDQGAVITPQNQAEAVTINRQLGTPSQLSEKVRSVLQLPNADIVPEQFGGGNHPFTTQTAGAENNQSPVELYPWNATGKLFMRFGNSNFVCTASVIDKNLLVTAAHCVHNFGQGQNGFADAVTFEPARHLQQRPFGTWTAKQWWIPKSYFDGTDDCSSQAPGVVCANDVAVVVLNPNAGQNIADVTGQYTVKELGDDGLREFGYVFFLGQNAAHITQLGYPARNYDGLQMIRTDSVGYQDEPNNVVIGSSQTGGSSGGPWLQNFGGKTSFSGEAGNDDDLNVVSAVTSWGYTLGDVKIQGASRFAKNSVFTSRSNIRALVDDACAANPDAC
ncbi:MAG: trypsin-like serine protease [Roseibium sp.]